MGSDAEDEAARSGHGFDGIASVDGKRLASAKTQRMVVSVEDTESEEDDVPILINPDLVNLKSVLDVADVILEVLDARDPLSFRSSHLEELASAQPGKRILLVMNKIGT